MSLTPITATSHSTNLSLNTGNAPDLSSALVNYAAKIGMSTLDFSTRLDNTANKHGGLSALNPLRSLGIDKMDALELALEVVGKVNDWVAKTTAKTPEEQKRQEQEEEAKKAKEEADRIAAEKARADYIKFNHGERIAEVQNSKVKFS